MGRLERHLDRDLLAKLKRGWKPNKDPEPLQRQKPPRAAETYRGARRNAVLRDAEPRRVWMGIKSVYRAYQSKGKKYPSVGDRQKAGGRKQKPTGFQLDFKASQESRAHV